MSPRKVTNWIEGFVEVTDNSEAPTAFRKWTAISVIASALQRKCSLPWCQFEPFYPNMYIVLVGPSGCRKGTAMTPGLKLLQKLGIKLASNALTREQLIRELCDSSAGRIEVGTDGKPSMHSSLTVYSKELTVFLGHNNDALMSDLTDWYDCDDIWVYRTKTQGSDEIRGVWVNMIGATTPMLIQSSLPADAIGGGLTSRMIFIFAEGKEKQVALPMITPEQEVLYDCLYHDLQDIYSMRGKFGVDDGFVDLWEQWYMQEGVKPKFSRNTRLEGYTERRGMHTLKLSMICRAAMGNDMNISKRDLAYAIMLLEEAEEGMPSVFKGFGANPKSGVMAKMMDMIKDEKQIKFMSIINELWMEANGLELQAMCKQLVGMGYATITKIPIAGTTRTEDLITYKDPTK